MRPRASLGVFFVLAEELLGALFGALAAHAEAAAEAARTQSRQAIAELPSLLGYPEEWAIELERQSYAKGKLWRISR
jgi:hypothetical protein